MTLSLIAAASENNVIGKNNTLPWHLPKDLEHYKELTLGTTLIMGRKTWESIPEKFRPLPKRKNVIITRQLNYPVPNSVEVFSNLEDALQAHAGENIMINGGAEIYRQTINQCDTIYLTRVHKTVEGDAFFPEINPKLFKEVAREDFPEFSFITYKKI